MVVALCGRSPFDRRGWRGCGRTPACAQRRHVPHGGTFTSRSCRDVEAGRVPSYAGQRARARDVRLGVGLVAPRRDALLVQAVRCPPAPQCLGSASFALLNEVYMGPGFYPWTFPSTQGVSESRPPTAGMATPPGRRTGPWSRRSPLSRPRALAISEAPNRATRRGLGGGGVFTRERRSAANFVLGTGYRPMSRNEVGAMSRYRYRMR